MFYDRIISTFAIKYIFRDLKPENILLNENMHIQITDFGSAKILKGEEESKPEEGMYQLLTELDMFYMINLLYMNNFKVHLV